MEVDYELIDNILSVLNETYPHTTNGKGYERLKSLAGGEENLLAHLMYLEEHELLISGRQIGINGYVKVTAPPKLTGKGYDFLSKDGGLTAILKAVTVKFHQEAMQQLVAMIQASNVPPQEKRKLIDQLKLLPADATKQLLTKLVDQGLDKIPDVVQWLYTVLHQ